MNSKLWLAGRFLHLSHSNGYLVVKRLQISPVEPTESLMLASGCIRPRPMCPDAYVDNRGKHASEG